MLAEGLGSNSAETGNTAGGREAARAATEVLVLANDGRQPTPEVYSDGEVVKHMGVIMVAFAQLRALLRGDKTA